MPARKFLTYRLSTFRGLKAMKLPFLTTGTVLAHCDVPCGIYDPSTAQIAAMSTARFLDLIAELGTPDSAESMARLSRLTSEKEQHAAEVKAAVVVIWGDYFKDCLLYTSPSPRDRTRSRMPSSA